MNLKIELEKYIPFNEQEVVDKEYFLKFINSFDDTLTRENVFGHFTASGFVLNKERNKILLVYHNILGGYIFPGGHLDGIEDSLEVSKREIEEETGVKAKEVFPEIFSIWSGPVKAHYKRGKFVSAHTHLDIVHLFEAMEDNKLKVKPDENQSVIWAEFDKINKEIKLIDFFQPVYEKFIAKLKELNIKNN